LKNISNHIAEKHVLAVIVDIISKDDTTYFEYCSALEIKQTSRMSNYYRPTTQSEFGRLADFIVKFETLSGIRNP
jgi:hypothetical protein